MSAIHRTSIRGDDRTDSFSETAGPFRQLPSHKGPRAPLHWEVSENRSGLTRGAPVSRPGVSGAAAAPSAIRDQRREQPDVARGAVVDGTDLSGHASSMLTDEAHALHTTGRPSNVETDGVKRVARGVGVCGCQPSQADVTGNLAAPADDVRASGTTSRAGEGAPTQ